MSKPSNNLPQDKQFPCSIHQHVTSGQLVHKGYSARDEEKPESVAVTPPIHMGMGQNPGIPSELRNSW